MGGGAGPGGGIRALAIVRTAASARRSAAHITGGDQPAPRWVPACPLHSLKKPFVEVNECPSIAKFVGSTKATHHAEVSFRISLRRGARLHSAFFIFASSFALLSKKIVAK